jgi:HPt (histidine-containing phosphotransfer) domain-containing protein
VTNEPTSAQEINITRFKELADGEISGLIELMNLYITKTGEQVEQLQKALNDKSKTDLARVAHSMIGANLMVGMDSIVPPLRSLEQTAERGDFTRAASDVSTVRQLFERIKASLQITLSSL